MRTATIAAIASVSVAGVLAAGPAASAAVPASSTGSATLPDSGKALPRYAPLYMTTGTAKPTQADAVEVARDFDIVVAQPYDWAPFLPAMKSANPNLVVLGYVNGTFSSNGTSYPETEYTHDSNGHRVSTFQFGQDQMNPKDPRWRSAVANTCKTAVLARGYNGCFLDSMGQGPFYVGYVTATPVDPDTGALWDKAAWIDDTSGIVNAVKATNPGVPVVPNGLASGNSYFDKAGTAPLATVGSGAMAELWLRGPGTPVTTYKKELAWKKDVDMLADAESHGDSVLSTTKLWVNATPAQTTAWHRYALASFLLGTSGRSYFNFSTGQNWSQLAADSSADHPNLGAPSAAYTKTNGVYQRRYANGLVLVNPGTTNVTVNLDRSYHDVDGSASGQSVTLVPNGAAVLTNG